MSKIVSLVFVLLVLATSAVADSKLEKATAKAYEQVEKGEPQKAVKTLTKAAKKSGAPGYIALGRLHESLDRLDEAEEAYRQAVELATPAEKSDALVQASTLALRTGTGKEALKLAGLAIESEKTAATLAAKARAQVRRGHVPEALETASRAVSLDDSCATAHLARGEALLALGRDTEALEALFEAVDLDPQSALATSRLALAQLAIGRTGEAMESARRATELDVSFGEGFAILGEALLADTLDNWGEAIAMAQQGAFLDPTSPLVQTTVGMIFLANGQRTQAEEAYRRALMADPEYAPARTALNAL